MEPLSQTQLNIAIVMVNTDIHGMEMQLLNEMLQSSSLTAFHHETNAVIIMKGRQQVHCTRTFFQVQHASLG